MNGFFFSCIFSVCLFFSSLMEVCGNGRKRRVVEEGDLNPVGGVVVLRCDHSVLAWRVVLRVVCMCCCSDGGVYMCLCVCDVVVTVLVLEI